MVFDLEFYQHNIKVIQTLLEQLLIKKKELERKVRSSNNEKDIKLLEMINEEIINYKKLKRRAKCHLYDFKYRKTEKYHESQIKALERKRKKLHYILEKRNG